MKLCVRPLHNIQTFGSRVYTASCFLLEIYLTRVCPQPSCLQIECEVHISHYPIVASCDQERCFRPSNLNHNVQTQCNHKSAMINK